MMSELRNELRTRHSMVLRCTTEDRARLAKLGMAMEAVRRAAVGASGSCWELLSSMFAVLVALWTLLGVKLCGSGTTMDVQGSNSVQVQPSCDQIAGRGEEQRILKAMGPKSQKKARGDEPASKFGRVREHEPTRGIPREDEPGMSPCFRVENEPSKEESADDDEAELAGWLCCGMPVGDEGSVAGQLSTSSESFCLVHEDQNDEHHCPSGCPGIGSAVEGSVGAMERVETASLVKLAAVRVRSEAEALDIWEEPRYQSPPNHRKDSWLDVAMDRGWLIRAHGSDRVRSFHPVHRGAPISVDDILKNRVTVAFDNEGNRVVIKDRWATELGNVFTPKKVWRGWTFFELRTPMRPSYGARYVEHTPLARPSESSASHVVEESRGEAGTVASGSRDGTIPRTDATLPPSGIPEDQRGYSRGGANVRGRVVADQLPLAIPPRFGLSTLTPGVEFQDEDPLSDESEWDKITVCSLVD